MSTGKKRAATVAALTVVAAGVAVWAGVGRPEAAHGQTAGQATAIGITVTGVGTIKAAPDRADFSFGVETQAETAEAALATNNAAVQKVIAAVRAAGAINVQTQQVSVYPRYATDGTKIVGYSATNTVSARISDLAKAGAIVEAALKAGANQVFGPQFSIGNQSALYKNALNDAYADARSKAQSIAGATGVALGRVVNVVEGGGFFPTPLGGRDEGAPAEAPLPLEPGLQEIQASLTVTFLIS
jgi:uncharacterized protein YggE